MTDNDSSAPQVAPTSDADNASRKRKRDEDESPLDSSKRRKVGVDSTIESTTTVVSSTSENASSENVSESTTVVSSTSEKASESATPAFDPYTKLVKNLRNIFRFSQNIKYPSPEVLSYVTPYNMAQSLIRWINAMHYMTYANNQSRFEPIYEMIDLTACIGGNVLEFAAAYQHVTCMELNKDSYECLRHNIDAYRLGHKVRATNENSMDWLFDAKRPQFRRNSGVFYDPPWGGREYNDRDTIPDLPMSDSEGKEYSVYDILRRCMDLRAAIVCIKLPYNFDCDQFRQRGYSRSFEMRYNKCVYVVVFPQRVSPLRR